MAEEKKEVNQYFLSLLFSLSGAAWQALGKIPSPITDKMEKNIESAKVSIDMLEMLREKTKGNLTGDEIKLLDNSIADLQINYVDEIGRGATGAQEKAAQSSENKEEKKETGS